MKNIRLARTLISVVLCILFLAIPAGNAYAMPFSAAVNYGTGFSPFFVAVGDFNEDGKLDLATANYDGGTVSILIGDGLGGFGTDTEYAAGSNPFSVTVGDFNLDGHLDLVVTNHITNTVSILLGVGDGTFILQGTTYAVGTWPGSVAVGDLNGDGKPDLAVANYGSGGAGAAGSVTILIGDGLGGFSAGIASPWDMGHNCNSVAVRDFNGDNKLDMVTANRDTVVCVRLGNGDGTFGPPVEYGTHDISNFVSVGDFNGDSIPDLAVANSLAPGHPGTVSILLGNVGGTFNAATNYPSLGESCNSVTVDDFNGDGKPDLAVANNGSDNVSVLLGDGLGAFPVATVSLWAAGPGPRVAASGDFNLDGAPDLAVANGGSSTVSILLNTPEPPTVTAVNPASGNQGQSLPVIITGTRFAGPTTVSFGAGITVNSITVNSVTHITANISITADAAPGARNVTVTTPGGTATLTGGFTVIEVIEVQPNPFISMGTPTSHGSSVAAPTTPAPPVSLPSLVIQSASLSAKAVTPGTPVTVTADIANKSAVNGNKKVTLYVNGQVETTQGVAVNSGSSSKLTFNVSRSEPGDYTVYVDGVPAGSFKVELFRESDGILIFSAVLVALAFLIGVVMLRRRQRAA